MKTPDGKTIERVYTQVLCRLCNQPVKNSDGAKARHMRENHAGKTPMFEPLARVADSWVKG